MLIGRQNDVVCWDFCCLVTLAAMLLQQECDICCCWLATDITSHTCIHSGIR